MNCVACQTALKEDEKICHICHLPQDLENNREDLIAFIDDRLGLYVSEYNERRKLILCIRNVLYISLLDTTEFRRLDKMNCDLLINQFYERFHKLPEWKRIDQVEVRAFLRDENREHYLEHYSLKKKHDFVLSRRDRLRSQLKTFLEDDLEYDGYYDTRLPIDYGQTGERRFSLRHDLPWGYVALIGALSLVALGSFTIPFIF